MQLSNQYKSSAELVSELLQRPLQLTRDSPTSNDKMREFGDRKCFKLPLKKSKSDSKSNQFTEDLKSVELVRKISLAKRKLGRDESQVDQQSDQNSFQDCGTQMIEPLLYNRFSWNVLSDTEDLYCDDELHPNLENEPNMKLYTENTVTEEESDRIFDTGDNCMYDTLGL